MDIFHCSLRIRSVLELEEVGWIISDRVLGGVPLGGRADYIRDEVPAIYTRTRVLGMEFILQGEPDEEGYYLTGDPADLMEGLSIDEFKSRLRDISDLVARLLEGGGSIEVFADPPFKPGTHP